MTKNHTDAKLSNNSANKRKANIRDFECTEGVFAVLSTTLNGLPVFGIA